jgi:hypothetical protein
MLIIPATQEAEIRRISSAKFFSKIEGEIKTFYDKHI